MNYPADYEKATKKERERILSIIAEMENTYNASEDYLEVINIKLQVLSDFRKAVKTKIEEE